MSTVIKANQSTRMLHRLSTVDLADHMRQAKDIVEEARQEAADILSRAESEARQVRAKARNDAQQAGFDEGRTRGYAEGVEAGMTAGHAEAFEQANRKFQEDHSLLVADLERAVGQIDAIKQAVRSNAERHVLDLALQLASRLTYEMGRHSTAVVAANLARALELVHDRTNLIVSLHPDDAAQFEQLSPDLAERLANGGDVKLVKEESIARGGCIVRNARTEVDARLETQLAEIVSLLVGNVPRSEQAEDSQEPGGP